MIILGLVQYRPLLPLSLLQWRCCSSFTWLSEALLRSNCYDQRMDQGGSVVLVHIATGVHCCVHVFGFCGLIIGRAFDSNSAYLAYLCSAEIHWSSLDIAHCSFTYSFADGRIFALKLFSCCGREKRVGILVQKKSSLTRILSGRFFLLTVVPCRAPSHTGTRLHEQIHRLRAHIMFRRALLMLPILTLALRASCIYRI